jgi:hypothetical protein
MPISDDKSAREAKLAEALRTNLRKRQVAARPASSAGDRAVEAAEAAPRPYSIVRRLEGVNHRDGQRVDLLLEISAPYRAPDSPPGSDEMACAVRLVGDGGQFDSEHGKAAFGLDGLQALKRALDLAQVALDVASTTHDLRWPDDRPYDLSAPI